MSSYGHDLYGAAIRGYARRTRQHIAQALDNAHGWSDPYDSRDKAHGGWRLALDALLTEAKRRGETEDEITAALERAKAAPGEFGDSGKARDRQIARAEQRYSEDPSKGLSLADLSAELEQVRDRAHLRRLVLAERALRISAQYEAGIE